MKYIKNKNQMNIFLKTWSDGWSEYVEIDGILYVVYMDENWHYVFKNENETLNFKSINEVKKYFFK
jgi:hypothetical protein